MSNMLKMAPADSWRNRVNTVHYCVFLIVFGQSPHVFRSKRFSCVGNRPGGVVVVAVAVAVSVCVCGGGGGVDNVLYMAL